jgi:predicted sugar kinase
LRIPEFLPPHSVFLSQIPDRWLLALVQPACNRDQHELKDVEHFQLGRLERTQECDQMLLIFLTQFVESSDDSAGLSSMALNGIAQRERSEIMHESRLYA